LQGGLYDSEIPFFFTGGVLVHTWNGSGQLDGVSLTDFAVRLMEGDSFTDGPDNGNTGITVYVSTITYGTASSGPSATQPGSSSNAPDGVDGTDAIYTSSSSSSSSGDLAPGADLLGVAYITICRPSSMGLTCESDCGDGG
jgi:hypothetical protein